MTHVALAALIGTTHSVVASVVKDLGLTLARAKTGRGRVTDVISPEQVELIKQHPTFSTPTAPTDCMSMSAIAAELGIGQDKLKGIVRELGIVGKRYKNPVMGIVGEYFSPEHVAAIKQHPSLNVPYKENPTYFSLNDSAAELGTSRSRLKKIISELDIKPYILRNPVNGKPSTYLSPEQRRQINLF